MRYDLAAIARQTHPRRRPRRPVTMRPIEPAHTLIREAALIGLKIVARWQEVANGLLGSYEGALRQTKVHPGDGIRDAAGDNLAVQLARETEQVARLLLTVDPELQAWGTRVETWHRRRFSGVVRIASGVEVYPMLSMADVENAVAAALERHAALIRGLSADMEKRVQETVWREFLNQTPRRELGKMLGEQLDIGRNRANFIASDQTMKLSAELNKERSQQAGIEQFRWRTAGDSRVRPEHAALEGKIFYWTDPPSIGLPGTPPRCRCVAQSFIDLMAETAA